MTAKAKTAAQVGDIVLYQGRSGVLPALVLMTPESFNPEKSGYEAPDTPDCVSLEIHRLSGRTYVRHNVPMEGSDAHKVLVDAKDARDVEIAAFVPEVSGTDWYGEPTHTTAPKPVVVRSWKFKG